LTRRRAALADSTIRWLITRRSEVQILPPPPSQSAGQRPFSVHPGRAFLLPHRPDFYCLSTVPGGERSAQRHDRRVPNPTIRPQRPPSLRQRGSVAGCRGASLMARSGHATTQRPQARHRSALRGVRDLASVGCHPQLGDRSQLDDVTGVDAAHLEPVVWADDDAVPLAFAASEVDDRRPRFVLRGASLAGAVGVLGSSTPLTVDVGG
jgi:hypothetical protein